MAGVLKKYSFINAKLRARLSKILSPEFIGQMIRAASLPECIQLLAGTQYESVERIYNKTGDLKLAELELYKIEVALYTDVEKHVSGEVSQVVEALALQFETENLKNVLRLWFDRNVRGRDIDNTLGYLSREKVHHDLEIDSILGCKSLEEVQEVLRGTPYPQLLREASSQVMSEKNIFPIELAIDHYYYRQLLAAIGNLKSRDKAIAGRLIGVAIDMQNINWIVRFKMSYKLPLADALRYCIPSGYNLPKETIAQAYGAENVTDILSGLIKKRYPSFHTLLSKPTTDTYGRLLLVERILEEILNVEINRVLAGYPFTIGIILAYFIRKGNSIKKIMTILNAKYYGIGGDRIQSGL